MKKFLSLFTAGSLFVVSVLERSAFLICLLIGCAISVESAPCQMAPCQIQTSCSEKQAKAPSSSSCSPCSPCKSQRPCNSTGDNDNGPKCGSKAPKIVRVFECKISLVTQISYTNGCRPKQVQDIDLVMLNAKNAENKTPEPIEKESFICNISDYASAEPERKSISIGVHPTISTTVLRL